MVNHILKLPLSFKIRSDFLSKKASIGSSNLFFEDAEEILISGSRQSLQNQYGLHAPSRIQERVNNGRTNFPCHFIRRFKV